MSDRVDCPYCGHTMRDLWDFDWRDDEEDKTVECDKCEREFVLTRRIWVDYSARSL